MTTATSVYNPQKEHRFSSLVKKTISQRMSFAIITAIITFLCVLLPFLMEFFDNLAYRYSYPWKSYLDYGVYGFAENSYIIIFFLSCLTVIIALISNGYMHSKAKTDFFHSMPVKREKLLVANGVGSLLCIIVPFVAIYLITMVLQLIILPVYITPMYFLENLFELGSVALYLTLIYSFITFFAVNVGTIFDTIISAGIIAFIPAAIYGIIGALWDTIAYGGSFSGELVWYLSPALLIFTRTDDMFYRMDRPWGWAPLIMLVVTLAYTVLFVFLSIYSYKKRRSEQAEQKSSTGWPQIVTKTFVAFIGAAAFCAIFMDIHVIIGVLASFVGAILFGGIAEIILNRGIAGFVKSLKWLVGAGVAFCLIFVFIQFDFIGYNTRVPNESQIASVVLSTNRTSEYAYLKPSVDYQTSVVTLTDPEAIAIVRDTHKIITENQPYGRSYYEENNSWKYERVDLEYKLKNGSRVRRSYSRVYENALVRLAGLEVNSDYLTKTQPIFFVEEDPTLYGQMLIGFDLYNALSVGKVNLSLTYEQNSELIKALREDMLTQTMEEIENPSKPALGYITIRYREPERSIYFEGEEAIIQEFGRSENRPTFQEYNILLTSEYVKTKTFLTTVGLADTLLADTSEVTSVVFRADSYYGSSPYINTYFNLEQIYHPDYFIANGYYFEEPIKNPALITEILSKVVNQRAVATTDKLYEVFFFAGDKYIGTQVIAESDVPQEVLDEDKDLQGY